MNLNELTNGGEESAEGNIVGGENSSEPRLAIWFWCVEDRMACMHSIFVLNLLASIISLYSSSDMQGKAVQAVVRRCVKRFGRYFVDTDWRGVWTTRRKKEFTYPP